MLQPAPPASLPHIQGPKRGSGVYGAAPHGKEPRELCRALFCQHATKYIDAMV